MSDTPLDPKEILTRERVIKAVRTDARRALTPYDPGESRRLAAEHPDLQLTATEREAIRQALADSPRLLARFASSTLQRWDDLWSFERAEALDLFADIVHHPYFGRRPLSIPEPEPGIER